MHICRHDMLVLFETISDPTFCQVVRGHFDQNFVAGQDTDPIFPHFTSCVTNDLVIIFQLYPKRRIGKQFHDRSIELNNLFF